MLLKKLYRLIAGQTSKNTPSRPRTSARPAVRPALEGLEGREVPAVALTALNPVLDRGVLTVIGNENANTIDVTLSNGRINVLGRSFAASSVTTIVLDGKGGDDTLRVSESITRRAYLYGGYGADKLYGGGGGDVIYG